MSITTLVLIHPCIPVFNESVSMSTEETPLTQPSGFFVNILNILSPLIRLSTLIRSNLLLHRVFVDHFNQIRHDVTCASLASSTFVRLGTCKPANRASSSKERVTLEVSSSGIFAAGFDKTAIQTVDADLRKLEAKEQTCFYRQE